MRGWVLPPFLPLSLSLPLPLFLLHPLFLLISVRGSSISDIPLIDSAIAAPPNAGITVTDITVIGITVMVNKIRIVAIICEELKFSVYFAHYRMQPVICILSPKGGERALL